MARLELDHVTVHLGGAEILRRLSLTVEDGECVALLGPSGCGKTTTLRTVAGFVDPSAGDVRIGGQSVLDMPPHKRNIGLVFQDFALFPHMTASENVAYGLQMRGLPREEIRQRVTEALDTVQLDHLAGRWPSELSGGQRQRVALARAIVIRPDMLLLDEPLGALDRKLRDAMQVELKQLQRQLGITTIIVTHDQEEALSLANRVAVMFDGVLAALGEPETLYERPGTRQVMEFLGASNTLEGELVEDSEGGLMARCSCGTVVRAAFDGRRPGDSVRVGIRPEHLELGSESERGGPNSIDCHVEEIVYKGGMVEVYAVGPGGRRFHVNTNPTRLMDAGIRRGATVRLALPPRHVVPLDNVYEKGGEP